MGHKCCFHNQRANVQRRNYVACESAVAVRTYVYVQTLLIRRKKLLSCSRSMAIIIIIIIHTNIGANIKK